MKTIKAAKLKKGDTIGFIGVSGRIKEYERLENAKKFFEEQGFNIVISESCKTNHRYMAGNNDLECVNTLHEFFLDKNINAIVCARGGYGAVRLLKYIDFGVIKNNPKIFAGYSDITAFLNVIYAKTGLITFHSAMPNGDFSSELQEYTVSSFFDTLEGKKRQYKSETGKVFYPGTAKGRLWGGNLATLTSLCGTDFIPDENLILFVEDLNEPVYKIDRMLTQLFNVKKLRSKVKGIAIGEFKDVEEKDLLHEVIFEVANELKIPVSDGFRITHGKIKDTLPVGVPVTFDSDIGIINVCENYLTI